ncbi:right-handed parallel beta-helix repeat-containing protein [Tamlana sp. 2_MG-2023]|uniref:right-handed parallel beta-helix repeat-containing protein n=1 Tax=unclassified Tamlana TaxID=2614803 RepID=UPI0026E175E0|nr:MULTISPECIES: right-handed parallel beta-helix repeat-containing protein [unclassified Tamlana]MDO6760980.1 right-handed parallel beta-helix repeat-containing protein [Tamlana sp. 2_MG-2023]MDO6791236.1 right-handed parallel beta-helix repeat-containing protein [Tamlana sp. 1_MG-2023]
MNIFFKNKTRLANFFTILFLITTTLVSSWNSPVKKGETVLFKTEIGEDATPVVVARLLKAEGNPISEIKFEKGTYHFYPDKGFEKYCYISNHGDLMVKTPFPIFNMKDLIIDGQGSTFIFHGIIIPFLINESENITVKNLSIDWNEPFHSEGLIVANDEKNKTFDMQISDEYPYEIRNNQIFFIKEYYEHSLGQSILFDPKRKAVTYNTQAYTGISTIGRNSTKNNLDKINYKYEHDDRAPEFKDIGTENRLVIEQLKPGLVRVHNHKKEMPPKGMILTMKGEQGFNRVSPAIRVTHTNGFNATNVNIHHAGGMGIIAENSADLILDNFNIIPSHGRMVSTTADATHFVGCRGKVVLKNCTFNNQLDDAMNVHGTYQKIVDVLDDYSIGVRMMHHQQLGFIIGYENDNIGFVRLSNSFLPYNKGTIKKTEYLNNRYQIITFNEKLPAELKTGDLIENLDGYPDLLVQNCNIGSNRARGLLISNPLNTVIENNVFNTEMEAILVPVESGYWYESGNAANVIIRNNEFKDCQYGGNNRGVIRFVTDDDNENIAFKNIEISNNTFNQFDNLILQVTNADGIKFTNNKITNSGTFPRLYPENPVIQVKSSKNIIFKNNKYSGLVSPNSILQSDISELNFK